MTRLRRHHLSVCGGSVIRLLLVWSLLPAGVSAAGAWADQPRARTLKYDPDQRKSVEVPPPPLGTPEGDLHAIRVQLKAERYRQALSSIRAFNRRYGRHHALHPAVMLARAEALVGREAYYKAHLLLQEFLNQFPGLEPTAEALRLEFVIAETFLSGVKRRFAGLRILSGLDIAYSILDDISINFPDSDLAPLAIKTKADHLFEVGDHALAQLEYERLLRQYPASRYHQSALRRSADAALAYFAGVDYDDTPLLESWEWFNEYRLRYPTQADREGVGLILGSIRAQRAAKDYFVGRYYERTDHTSSAVFYYRLVCEKWPDTVSAAQARSRLELLGALEPASDAEAETAPRESGDTDRESTGES